MIKIWPLYLQVKCQILCKGSQTIEELVKFELMLYLFLLLNQNFVLHILCHHKSLDNSFYIHIVYPRVQQIQTSQMEPKKTKKISKPPKPKEEEKEKKPRNVVSKALGRPKDIDGDDFEIPIDKTEDIKNVILKYLDNIGLFHGLVFREEDRQKLNKDKSSAIQWKCQHSWDPEQEEKKAKEHINQINFDKLKKKLKLSRQFNTLFFEKLYLDVSEIICDEATHEIYEIMTEMIAAMDDKEATQSKTEGLLAKLVMFTGRFTKITIKYYIEIQDQEKIKKLFRIFLKDIQSELKKIIRSQSS